MKFITSLVLTTAAVLFIALNCQSQNSPDFRKIIVNPDDELTGYYLITEPEKVDMVLVLLPGFGQYPESIYYESKLPSMAAENNILVIAFAGGRKIYADKGVVANFDKILIDASDRFELQDKNWAIGGFSAGGTLALRYTEFCYEFPDDHPVKPDAAFTVDSPIDLFGLWKYLDNEIEKNFSEVGVNEAKFVASLMESEIGNLNEQKLTYEKLTPYNSELKEMGNERFLMKTAVRVYHDVDVAWLIENRRRSAFDSNYLYASDMINTLRLNGHEQAEFIQGKTGFRRNGDRHPHSWSIVDEEECIEWLLANTTKKKLHLEYYNK